jgi:hypothetical protein
MWAVLGIQSWYHYACPEVPIAIGTEVVLMVSDPDLDFSKYNNHYKGA